MIRQVIQRISNPEASIESLQERRFWLQCERAYTWQPIYQTCGRLMAVELLTVVTHPLNPSQRLPPDRYFTEITVSHRMEVVKEQIDLLDKTLSKVADWLKFAEAKNGALVAVGCGKLLPGGATTGSINGEKVKLPPSPPKPPACGNSFLPPAATST